MNETPKDGDVWKYDSRMSAFATELIGELRYVRPGRDGLLRAFDQLGICRVTDVSLLPDTAILVARAGQLVTAENAEAKPPEVIRVCTGCLGMTSRHARECPVRIHRAQLLEGGHSAALSAPARVLSPWVPSVSEWDLLPDA